jgi:DNA-binding NarL/FixJ family response regulator
LNESGVVKIIETHYDLASCREGLKKNPPDVLLLDVRFPDGDGVDFCSKILNEYRRLKIIMLSGAKEFTIVKQALKNGALGYILKSSSLQEILTGIKTVNNGKEFLCKEIEELMKDKKTPPGIFLTKTEQGILKYISDGFSTREIGRLMYRSTQTIKSHRRNLFIKFKAKNMADLIEKAHKTGLISEL